MDTLKEQKEHFIKFYGRRLPVHDYDYFKQRFNEIINSVKKDTVNECITKVNAIKPNKIITELKLHWCIIEELKAIRNKDK